MPFSTSARSVFGTSSRGPWLCLSLAPFSLAGAEHLAEVRHGFRGQSRGTEGFIAGRGQLIKAAESIQEAVASNFADPDDLIELRRYERLAPQFPMECDREPVGFVPDSL
jgi:hypothetical protein